MPLLLPLAGERPQFSYLIGDRAMCKWVSQGISEGLH